MRDTSTSRRNRRFSVFSLVVAAALAGAGCTESKSAAPEAAGKAPTAKPDKEPAAKAPAKTPAAAGAAGHCDVIKSAGSCREYSAFSVEAAGEKSLRDLCGVGSGAYAAGPCPTAGVIATCEKPDGTDRYYAGGVLAYTVEKAKKTCAEALTPGKFRAGP